MKQYEAMFLFDPTFGSSFENCEKEIQRLMERAQAEIVFLRRWDERRLAYRIKGRKRGVYVLVYFKAPPDKIAPLERDVQLSENILRILVVRAEGITREYMERVIPGGAEEPLRSRDDTERSPGRSAADEPGRTDDKDGTNEPDGAAPVATEVAVEPEEVTGSRAASDDV